MASYSVEQLCKWFNFIVKMGVLLGNDFKENPTEIVGFEPARLFLWGSLKSQTTNALIDNITRVIYTLKS